MFYLSNAFSLQMIKGNANINIKEVNLPAIAHKISGLKSVVGHSDTATLFSILLGVKVSTNRENITLNPGDTLYVGQIQGGRLPEGCTELPEGITIKWLAVNMAITDDPYKIQETEKLSNKETNKFGTMRGVRAILNEE